MVSEEANQLVVLGNGFDLKLGLKTKFEDYLGIFSIDKVIEESNIDILFSNLKKSIKNDLGLNRYLIDLSKDQDIGYKETMKEIISNVKSINVSNCNVKQKLLLNFHIEVRFNFIKLITQEFRRNPDVLIKHSDLVRNLENELGRYREQALSIFKINDKSPGKLNFWDVYFLYLQKEEALKDDSSWSDVEYQILRFYKKGGEEPAKYNGLISTKSKKLISIFRTLTDNKVSLNNVDEYLYQELIRFSQNFVNYLKSQYSQCYYGRNDYKLNSRWKFIDEKIADSEKYELLNFNYTNAEGYGCIKQIHIHGNKDKHNEIPIIGINAEDLTSNKEHAFKLTKQYQLISSENNKVEKLDLENIKRIVFYGHSLALADYQYFRNIFNRISLAESSVQLVFKYSKGHGNYDSIFRLLDRYSKDIDIDITTTLTLENRLKVEEIPD